ncbi:MAG: sigma-54 dependent transcriptional regulator [Thermodesulfobacteriota bacterium]
MARLLIIDDDLGICQSLRRVFTDLGHDVLLRHTLEEGLEAAVKQHPDAVFLDVRLPDGNGLEYLPLIQKAPSQPEVIVMTGFADAGGAREAISADAWDYIQKPATADSLVLALQNALQYREQKQGADLLPTLNRCGILGESSALANCLRLAAKASRNQANVLVSGETGTGKELFARCIHENSTRREANFVVVDCAAIPKHLVENLLFGHVKGAYTGAHKSESGLVKHADGGTLFLDEIGELSLTTQKAFLRVLEEHAFRPVGSLMEVSSDFRLVSATNRDLDRMAAEGKFREDLLFRIRAISLNLPPLRERADDIPALAEARIAEQCRRNRIHRKTLSPQFVKALQAFDWPGNVRELLHAMDAVFAEAVDEPVLFSKHLPSEIRTRAAMALFPDARPEAPPRQEAPPAASPVSSQGPPQPWQEFRKGLVDSGEKSYLQGLLATTGGDIKRAAEISGLSLPRLYELFRKHGITSKYVPAE